MLLSDIVYRQAALDPGRLALVDGEQQLTFGTLAERVGRLSDAVGKIAEPGDRVALLARNGVPFVDCYYGVPAAGMVLTMLNFRLHPRDWAWILDNCAARVLIIEQEFLEAIEPVLSEVGSVERVIVVDSAEPSRYQDYERFLAEGSDRYVERAIPDDSPAWIVYTSGTTGFPKGAVLTHRSILASATQSALEFDVRSDDRMLMCFPLCHVAGYAVQRFHLRGAAVFLTAAFDPQVFLRLVEKHRITASALAPTMLIYLMRCAEIDDYDTSSLRSVGFGSANLPAEVLRDAVRRFGPVLFSGFGMTELSGDVLVVPREVVSRAVDENDESLLKACGRPMCLADVRIVDEALRECPIGEVGEIVVRSDQLLRKYWNNAEATAEAMHGGWFHTGDIGRRDTAGFITVVDRKKDMIITGGENVYSREVEDAIAGLPGVVEVAVVGIPDPLWGESVAAVLVADPVAGPSAGQVMDRCRDRLARYKIPKRVEFVDALPKNGTGKVQKHRVRELLCANPLGN